MADMPIQCVVCGTNKNPSLMYSSDTCHECAEKSRLCSKCVNSSLKVRDRENWSENQPEPLREIPPMQIVADSRGAG
jgi:hypothetical protein